MGHSLQTSLTAPHPDFSGMRDLEQVLDTALIRIRSALPRGRYRLLGEKIGDCIDRKVKAVPTIAEILTGSPIEQAVAFGSDIVGFCRARFGSMIAPAPVDALHLPETRLQGKLDELQVLRHLDRTPAVRHEMRRIIRDLQDIYSQMERAIEAEEFGGRSRSNVA